MRAVALLASARMGRVTVVGTGGRRGPRGGTLVFSARSGAGAIPAWGAAMLMAALDIVIVEDSDTLREELALYLGGLGHAVRGCGDGVELDALLDERSTDLVILDLTLPGEDGLSIARRLRRGAPHLGIVMLSGREACAQRVAGYLHGADVYLTKPAALDELRAVVQSVARRLQRDALLSWTLDLRRAVVIGPQEQEIALTMFELDILRELALAKDRELATADLHERVNRGSRSEATRNALVIALSRLRTKLVVQLDAPDCLRAIRGHGYRLTVPLTVMG